MPFNEADDDGPDIDYGELDIETAADPVDDEEDEDDED